MKNVKKNQNSTQTQAAQLEGQIPQAEKIEKINFPFVRQLAEKLKLFENPETNRHFPLNKRNVPEKLVYRLLNLNKYGAKVALDLAPTWLMPQLRAMKGNAIDSICQAFIGSQEPSKKVYKGRFKLVSPDGKRAFGPYTKTANGFTRTHREHKGEQSENVATAFFPLRAVKLLNLTVEPLEEK